NRAVWRAVNGMIAVHPAMPPSHFFAVQAQNYATTQAVAVRRQADVSGQVITLGGLLADIAGKPEHLTRERYVSMYPWGMQHLGDRDFDAFTHAGGAHVDPTLVASDQRRLSDQSQSIRTYVNRRLAHFDKKPPPVPNFDDLDAAIDTLGSLFHKYNLLLTGADRAFMEPIPQYDWLAPFRIPWMT
ncbi:MAG TPA: hypothetical protein VNU19_08590, partial [Candidatus Acidoferrum sp.]|nr:hypothetical protein [Candidatus Acidoferrum sp.]